MDITKPEYHKIHSWLRWHHGRADHCEVKKCAVVPKRYGYALKKGKKYERNIDNYIQMCVSCHKKYDMNENIRLNLRKSKLGNHYKATPIIQIDKDTKKQIQYFSSAREAAKSLNLSFTAISNALVGYSESSGGFIWKFNNK